jgi:methylmalonyl-CoA mutase N-terminal domain/subunit
MGGTLAAIENGFIQREIQESSYRAQVAIDSGEAVVVGVNRFVDDDPDQQSGPPVFRIDPEIEKRQADRVRSVRSSRDTSAWQQSVDAITSAARDGSNLVPRIIAAVEAKATVGEIADAMRSVFGEYREAAAL